MRATEALAIGRPGLADTAHSYPDCEAEYQTLRPADLDGAARLHRPTRLRRR